MIVPMLARDQAVGAITLVAAESGRRFTAEDLALAEDLARRAAMAVDNARLYADAREAARARDRFLAVAAHELRSPLTATKGFAQLLLRRAARTPSGEEWIAPLRTIDNQVNKVATLVNRLLDVSRIQENRLQLQLEPDDLLAVVREAVAEQQLVAEGRRIILTCPLSELPGVWDRARLGQVLTNLLDNAVKYSPDDGEISVTLEQDNLAREVIISVHDDGAGISADGRARLFERDFRASDAASSGLEGMGLGLYVAKGIVDAHGGRIWLESAAGQGTTFYVALPTQTRPQAEPAAI
jgi:signal transduction histidine kinase